jgi:hypothetical protein
MRMRWNVPWDAEFLDHLSLRKSWSEATSSILSVRIARVDTEKRRKVNWRLWANSLESRSFIFSLRITRIFFGCSEYQNMINKYWVDICGRYTRLSSNKGSYNSSLFCWNGFLNIYLSCQEMYLLLHFELRSFIFDSKVNFHPKSPWSDEHHEHFKYNEFSDIKMKFSSAYVSFISVTLLNE